MKFAKVMTKGNAITFVFNTTLADNILKIRNSKLQFSFIDGVSDDIATNDFFASISHYID